MLRHDPSALPSSTSCSSAVMAPSSNNSTSNAASTSSSSSSSVSTSPLEVTDADNDAAGDGLELQDVHNSPEVRNRTQVIE